MHFTSYYTQSHYPAGTVFNNSEKLYHVGHKLRRNKITGQHFETDVAVVINSVSLVWKNREYK